MRSMFAYLFNEWWMLRREKEPVIVRPLNSALVIRISCFIVLIPYEDAKV